METQVELNDNLFFPRNGYQDYMPSWNQYWRIRNYWYRIEMLMSVIYFVWVNPLYSIQFCFTILANHFTFSAFEGKLV